MFAVMNSKRVQELREKKGLSRQKLAAAAGISLSTANRVEREEPVQVATAWKVAGAFGMHPRDIARPADRPRLYIVR